MEQSYWTNKCPSYKIEQSLNQTKTFRQTYLAKA